MLLVDIKPNTLKDKKELMNLNVTDIKEIKERGEDEFFKSRLISTECTMCGKTLDDYDKYENYSADMHIGYGSKYDMSRIRFQLCCDCFDRVLDMVIPLCKTNPVIEED